MASTYMDMTAANAALKEMYAGQVIQNLCYRDNPTLALIPKRTDIGGKYYPVPIQIAVSQGGSSTFSTAQTNQTAAVLKSFLMTKKSDYAIGTIDNQTMLSSKTDKMAFLEMAKVVIDSALRASTLSIASAMFRDGTGAIGKISSISTGVITLTDPTTVTQFEVNMCLEANDTLGGTSPRAALGYVIAVNRAAGTVTVAASLGGAAATPSSWTTNDYLTRSGDLNAKISGFQAWLPASAPSAGDNFYGVDRSVDSVRLAGVRYDGSAQTVEEALIDASSLVGREGGRPDVAVTNYTSYAALEKSLGSKVQYVDLKGPAEIAFRGIRIMGSTGEIKVFADRSCPGTTAYLLQLDTWTLGSLGEVPQILRYSDGLEFLRVSNSDSAEIRVGAYCNMWTSAPGWNAVVTLGV